ncbi:conserved hypothetical protein [Stackebrandtia nassauensis DSM 44728]|uniref:Histidine-specific methyltransferase SAM-dependent domain-containing protein n=1 Tax=Stackebrandtia nassauensis (strain DSM 44728 / CIP 108903 / NRRL B-16338 / NBRC 102104 / LLR-40K-21) TaxID=446470 RepID=D3PZ04_STANL|nr:conserved hypothetical protein [Stackebrandtia nassauensis DSM 44728]
MKPYVLIHCDYSEYTAALRADARSGLFGQDLSLPSRWCFDGRGRRLFGRLAAGSHSRLFRAEAEVLTDCATEFAEYTRARHLIQLGPAGSVPPLLLADSLIAAGKLTAVSSLDTPHAEVPEYPAGFPRLDLRHVIADALRRLPELPDPPRLIHCPAAGFATLDRGERLRLLTLLRDRCEPGDHLLVAAPLAEVPGGSAEFFDDPAGLGAEFNRNVLNVVNHTLDADVTCTAFEHVVSTPRPDRLELRLRARVGLRIELRTLGFHIDVDQGRELRTFRLFGLSAETLSAELERTGFTVTESRHDRRELVTLALAEAALTVRPSRARSRSSRRRPGSRSPARSPRPPRSPRCRRSGRRSWEPRRGR